MLEKLFEFINANTNSLHGVIVQMGGFFGLIITLGVQSIKKVTNQKKQNTILGIILAVAFAVFLAFIIGLTGANN